MVDDPRDLRAERERLLREQSEADGVIKQLLTRLKTLNVKDLDELKRLLPGWKNELQGLINERDELLREFWDGVDALGPRPGPAVPGRHDWPPQGRREA